MTVVGVDGWKDGWVAATTDDGRITWHAFRQRDRVERTAFRELLERFPDATIAVDIPIGTTPGPRRSDTHAQRWLQSTGASRSSIFPTPTTEIVDAARSGISHADAMRDRRVGSRVSLQAWYLIPKMIEVADALRATGHAHVYEAHPECSFRRLDERIGGVSKKSGVGVARRLRALAERAGYVLDLLAADGVDDVPMDDLLDSVAVLWTAQRIADRQAATLPEDPAPGEPAIHV